MRGVQLPLQFRRRTTLAGAGARATEAALVDALRALRDEARRDPRVLALPVRVVVPSRSLRLHLGARLPRELGPLVGVRIQTLHGLALELLTAEAPAARPGGALQDAFALRLARQTDALRPLAEGYADGHQGIAEAVRQLLDAGLVAGLVDAAAECLDGAEHLAPAERERAIAAVQVAAGTERLLDALGCHTPASVMRQAAECLGRPGPERLPSRAIFLHGFTDATAVAADLLAELARLPNATLTVDLPPDPAQPSEPDAGVRLGHRLRERLGGSAPTDVRRAPEPTLEVFAAEGEAELSEVARRVAALLDGGARPEDIGVVSAALPARAAALRRWFDRHAVPYSGLDARAPDDPDARWRGLAELLSERERLTVDRWLDLLGALDGAALEAPLRARVRLALRAAGCTRLVHVAELDADALLDGGDAVVLPGALGVVGERVERPRLEAGPLRAAVAAARAYVAWAAALPEQAPRSAWEAALATLAAALGRPEQVARWAGLAELPDLELSREELAVLLAAELAEAGRPRLGGSGGGVQVLAVREARARTFEHLFVLGNNRRAGGRRDALLSEGVRLALRAVLPDLPIARDRFDEDRLHFAWLCSAAPHVTLSWQSADARGKAQSVSPLVERLRWAGRWEKAPVVASPWATPLPPRAPAADHAVVAGLAGAPFLTRPLRAALAAAGHGQAAEVAAAQVATLTELDGRAPVVGPFHGALGAPVADDPRRRPLHVSVAESWVRCPWRTFLERHLGVEALPDPLEAVPQADERLVGDVVHGVLEAMVRRALPAPARSVRWALGAAGTPLAWPSPGELEAMVHATAERMLAEAGVRLPGLAHLVARRVAPMLDAARQADWAGAPPEVLGAEVSGSITVDGVEVHFRADRADRRDGDLCLTDFKSGRPPVRPGGDKQALLREVARGRLLQAAAYAAAAPGAVGRYLYLAPDLEGGRVIQLFDTDLEAREAMEQALGVAIRGMADGAWFPRLSDPSDDKEPRACGRCEVRDACLRGDSAARGRLFRAGRTLDQAARSGTELSPFDEAFRAAWWLPEARR